MNAHVVNGRIGGLTRWAHEKQDPAEALAPARRGVTRKFELAIDPDGVMDPQELAVRVERLRKAHMARLAQKSAEARRAKRAA